MKDLKFISPLNTKDHKLSNFADNVEVHFASRKKVQILARARNMLLQSDFSLPQVSKYLKSCLSFMLFVYLIQLMYLHAGLYYKNVGDK